MVELRVGAVKPTAMYIGGNPVQEVRVGSTLFWTPDGIVERFNRADEDELSSGWVNETPSADFHAGVVGGTLRMSIPDDTGYTPKLDSRFRNSTLIADDGWLEIKVAVRGRGGYITDVFRRYDSSGASAAGVGIRMVGSALSIVSRISSVDTVHKCGTYVAGDTLRIYQTEDLHELYRNGTKRGEWNDSGHTAHQGVGYRAVGVRVQGGMSYGGTQLFSTTLSAITAQ